MSKHIAKINRVPYLLWFNIPTIVEVDWQRGWIHNDFGTKSKIVKVNKWLVFVMKYLPLLLLLLIGGNAPQDALEVALFALGGIITYLSIWVFTEKPDWFKLYVVALCFGGLWLLLQSEIKEIGFWIDRTLLFATEALILGFVIHEIVTGKWDKYYMLKHVSSDITLKSERKSKPLLKIGNKELLNIKTGVDYIKTVRVAGFYAMIDDEIIVEEKEDEDEDNNWRFGSDI
ncbi:hypothetical protein [Sulfurimonas sp.]|uniref:hypothetical protein n=1 Tax=Sulfurimonas sp. TaxID=2022749 RepID=UPI0025F8B922|nr:hypothetical protein [Sulfurimonas sp.]MCK9454226.1 hypothetical protein [Sulfurimonas sp.]